MKNFGREKGNGGTLPFSLGCIIMVVTVIVIVVAIVTVVRSFGSYVPKLISVLIRQV